MKVDMPLIKETKRKKLNQVCIKYIDAYALIEVNMIFTHIYLFQFKMGIVQFKMGIVQFKMEKLL